MPDQSHRTELTSEMLLLELELNLWAQLAPIAYRNLTIIGVCCSDHDCCEVARWRVFWPGQTGLKCTAHRNGWTRIASVMGFDLISHEIDVREPDPTKARFAQMELY